MARSLKASIEGLKQAELAFKRKGWDQSYLAGKSDCTRQVVGNFFARRAVEKRLFQTICNELGLEWGEIAEPEADSQMEKPLTSLDELVQTVREKVKPDIQKRCGTMRVLDMTRPIDLDTIYTDVNILQEITGRQRLAQVELLKNYRVEEFDRLGFAHARRERTSGIAAVEKFDKLMLLGKPGAGKTTFLKRLATLCNADIFQGQRVPIFIALKEFADEPERPNLLTYINQWLHEMGIPETQTTEHLLEQGRGFLLLDGLDEVSETTSKQVLQEIQSFSNRFSKNAFVVSCRIAAKEFTFQQFTEVEVADFNDDQITDFTTRWFQSKQNADKSKQFLEKLQAYPRIKELATNPLLLTLLCLVFEGRTDFPANRSELYKEGLDVLLKKWDGTRSIEREQVYQELSLKRKEDLLSQLAFITFDSGNYFFKRKEAEHIIEHYIQNLPNAQTNPEALRLDSEAVLKLIEAQHGLLVERARAIYSFSHLTFHEYFTAREIETRDDLHQILISHLYEKRWREVFLLTVGMLKNTDSLLLLMKSQIDQLLADNEKLQHFLYWVQQKSGSVDVDYKPAAVRAFYFALSLALSLVLSRALDINIDLDIARALIHALDFDIDIAIDMAISRDISRDIDLDLDLALNRTLARDIIQDISHNPELKSTLQQIKDRLPNLSLKNQTRFIKWWKINGRSWIEQLRAVLIEHRNIGHDWEFTDTQKKLLCQYYEANKLLFDCLNSDCYVSREVREEIEATLLLPIAAP